VKSGVRRPVYWALARLRPMGFAAAGVLAAGLALGLTGCQLTRQNYQSVSLGMPAERVEQILGAPRYRFADEWVYTRDDPRDLVKVSMYFDAERRTIGKCWRNPEKPWENHREGEVPEGRSEAGGGARPQGKE